MSAKSLIDTMPEQTLPLTGLRVIELSHMVMGPVCGMILADLGAEVIKVEPPGGDKTRFLPGSGAGFFAAFNRNKKSVVLDISDPIDRESLHLLIDSADIFNENFKTGSLRKYGIDYESLSKTNPRLIYVSHKGFLPGPYENRTALDEVVQMLGGLAYMTGPRGRPLRAGASVNDIMGGMFGAIGALAAINERAKTGVGQRVESGLYENNVLLMAQHMMQYAVTKKSVAPMPERVSAWAVYDVFTVQESKQIFLAAVSDTQWDLLCGAFDLPELHQDQRLKTNRQRVAHRSWMLPKLSEVFVQYTVEQLAERFQEIGLPYAEIRQPADLFDDPHLKKSGGLADVIIPCDASTAGVALKTQTPLLPITMRGKRLPSRFSPPAVGEHSAELLGSIRKP
jgi:crotonobetainyl-CoA:carnitine CoA-transferase CaiB-like acyl-CoA transferase